MFPGKRGIGERLFQTIKVMALGFYGENAYLSDTWNRLDFFIVVAG